MKFLSPVEDCVSASLMYGVVMIYTECDACEASADVTGDFGEVFDI